MISSNNINKKRKEGLRPEVVGCFLHEKKVFMFYDKKHELWQFPQGGIENLETVRKTIEREMYEELGETFCKNVTEIEFMAEDRISFPKEQLGSRALQTDKGEKIIMKGKYYYAFAIHTNAVSLILEESEFDDFFLASFNQAEALAQKIYQPNKKRITLHFIDILMARSLII